MLGMTISRASSTFRVLGSMSRSLWLLLEKKNIIALVSTFINGFSHNCWVLQYLDFHGFGLKAKMTVTIFRKKNVMALVPAFIDGFLFNLTQMFGIIISRA